MRAVIVMNFTGARVVGQPRDWDAELDGEVRGLPIVPQVDTQSGLTFLYSVWRPDEDELAILNAGGAIRLGIAMPQHPIVNVATLTPEAVREAGCVDYGDTRA